MLRWIIRGTAFLAVLVALGVFAAWLVLSSAFLDETRRDLTARLLTREVGQVVQVNGGAGVKLGRTLHVSAEGLALPGQSMTGTTLAKVDLLQFDLQLRDLLRGRIEPSEIRVNGAGLTLVVGADGTSSWPVAGTGSAPDGSGGLDFLAGRNIRFSDSGLTYRNARNGLEFDVLFSSLDLGQRDRTAPVTLRGEATLNGQALSLNGNFPPGKPFNVTASFSQMGVDIDGTPDPDGFEAGYSVAISSEIADLGQLLDVFRLEKTLGGTGRISAVYRMREGVASLGDLDVRLALEGGQSLKVTGDLGVLDNPDDVTIYTNFQFYPDTDRPPATKTRRDLKLIAVDMDLISRPGEKQLRRMVIETNGFTLNTGGVGPPPISVAEISRTPEGLLRLGRVTLNIGPTEAPFLVLQGPVEDALRLEGINLKATLALPAASLVAPDLPQAKGVLGDISGSFRLIGDSEQLGLVDLNATTGGTDLWSLRAGGTISNLFGMEGIALDIAANVPSGAALLDALDLKAVDTGPVTVAGKLSSRGTGWSAETDFSVAQSRIGINMGLTGGAPDPTVRGSIDSELIKVDDIRGIVAVMLQLAKLKEQAVAAAEPPGEGDGAGPAGSGISEPPDLFSNVTLQPLGTAILMPGMDLGVTIDLQKIEGLQEASSIRSELEIRNRQVRFGPVKFDYDGGVFDLSGSMNLVDSPEILRLYGSAGGWKLGSIIQELGFNRVARGTLYARFDVSGNRASVQRYLRTMRGSATVTMKNGGIDTDILDLAGLGVIPWLFSKAPKNAATIVCLRAPLQIARGRVSSKQTVIETGQVQVVLLGNVDLRNETIDVMGQPRRIGKPLARSPWPFTAVGPLAKPRIRVKDGPRRVRRTDGASTMPQRRKLCVPDILQLK